MKFSQLLRLYFKYHWIRLVGCIIYGVLVTILYNFLNDGFKNNVFYFDGMFIGGATLFLFGLLTIVIYFGGLDIFSYIFQARRNDGHKESLYDYSVRKKEERRGNAFAFIDYLAIGTIYMIVSLFLL